MTDSMSLPGPSGKGIRTKLGCFTCRARKVKCDLSRPTCQTCTRLNLECTYTKPDKQLNIPRLRRGRKRRTSDHANGNGSEGTAEDDRRSSINTMPDLWGYQQNYGYPPFQQGFEARGRMSVDNGRMDQLASSAYLNSLMRPVPRRESMPIMLPSNYNPLGMGASPGLSGIGGGGGGGREGRYGSPNPNLFNGYQLGSNGHGHGHGNGVGSMGNGIGSSGLASGSAAGNGNGCTRDLPRSITPSSTSMTTPQAWDLPPQSDIHVSRHGSYQLGEMDIPQGQGQENQSNWNQSIHSTFDPYNQSQVQEPLAEYTDYRSSSNDWGVGLGLANRQYNTHPPGPGSNPTLPSGVRTTSPYQISYPTLHPQQSNSPNPSRSNSMSYPTPNPNPLPQSQSQSGSSSNSTNITSSGSVSTQSQGWPSATPQGYHYEEPKGYPPV